MSNYIGKDPGPWVLGDVSDLVGQTWKFVAYWPDQDVLVLEKIETGEGAYINVEQGKLTVTVRGERD